MRICPDSLPCSKASWSASWSYRATIVRARSWNIRPASVRTSARVDLRIDGGDLFQGTLASNLSYGRHVVEYYNRMGYVAAALGNHDLDWGQDTLKARMRQAKFAFLAANVRTPNGTDVSRSR